MVVPALLIAAVIAVLAAIPPLSKGYGGELVVARSLTPGRPALGLPADRRLSPADLEELRLSRGLWGCATRQVEELVDRAARALAERDAYIAELERRLSAAQLRFPPPGGQPGDGER